MSAHSHSRRLSSSFASGAAAPSAVSSFSSLPADASDAAKTEWRDAGMDAIAAGEVALIVLSGGQGTRLGFDIGLRRASTTLVCRLARRCSSFSASAW